MSQKHFLLKGTFILTVVGILTRVMGFFYRIFLSRSFPAEEIGLYQLIFPVYTLAYAATSAGIETALARLVAASSAKKQSAKAYSYLKAALLCSLFLSICCLFLLQKNAVFLTTVILGDPRCASLIFLIAYALPFAALHSCSCGYFLGLKQIRLPALSQLFEQLVRIFFVIFLYTADAHTAFTPSVAIAVLGIVGGEIAAAFLCIHKLRIAGQPLSPHRKPALSAVPPLLFSALPLTASRVLLNLFQSLEAISIPLALQKYGMSISASLSTYGILTGIALPCILFPSALTNSISTMLLPEVASMPDSQKKHALPQLLRKVIFFCLFLGFACLLFFFTASGFISRRIFHTPEAGNYILTLAFICPFLYSNTALISVLNGLDLAGKTFLINLFTLAVRICGVLFLIPQFGILGYLWALLASQLLTFGCCMFLLIKQGR